MFGHLHFSGASQRATILLALLASSGCGGDGLDRHQVKGTVTFDGKPVEYGSISFQPDVSVGRIAPTSIARIEGGEYLVHSNDGPVTGHYHVRVNGLDRAREKVDPGTGLTVTPSLFPEHVTTLDIPAPNGTFDIAVPASGQH